MSTPEAQLTLVAADRPRRGDVRVDPSQERVASGNCPIIGPNLAAAGVSWDRAAGTNATLSRYVPEKFSPPVVTNVVYRSRLHSPVPMQAAAVTLVAATAG